jgi:1-acyl-sn-glycerol-3-phosphate acyltransferase
MSLWGIVACLAFALACIFSLIVAVVLPWPRPRAQLIARATRAIFVLAVVRVQVSGLKNLPTGSCIVVANHASVVDGVLLKAVLPARFSFVIKGEMRNIPVVHFLLRRAGSKFVERKDVLGSSRDARQIVKVAQAGGSLAFFPEGTVHQEPGLMRFRGGAFVAAIKGNVPIVPVAIGGSRAMLPAGRFLPRRSKLTVDILPAIQPEHEAFSGNRVLAEASRQRILAVLDEPDLAQD